MSSPRRRLIRRGFAVVSLALISALASAWGSAFVCSPFGRSVERSRTVAGTAGVGQLDVLKSESVTGVVYAWTNHEILSWNDPQPEPRIVSHLREFFPAWACDAVIDQRFPALKQFEYRVLEARGFPIPMLWCRYSRSGTPLIESGLRVPGDPHRLLPGDDPFSQTVILPYHPIWWALAADIAFYALGWTLLLWAMASLRRHLRLRRNHCPKCNYNLRGLAPNTPCPECGKSNAPPIPSPSNPA